MATKTLQSLERGIDLLFLFSEEKPILSLEDLSRALSLNPEDAQNYNQRGVVHRKKGQLEKAVADHNRAIELAARAGEGYYFRGQAFFDQGQKEKARQDFQQACALGIAEGCRSVKLLEK